MRPFWDFAWEEPAVADFVNFGVDGASYTGAARHSAAYYASLLAAGVDVLGIMETTSTASQGGYNVGMQFVQFARARWREVGFPDTAPMAYALSDGSNSDPNYGGDQIAACGEGVGDYEVGPYLFYGNRYAVDHGCAGAAASMHPELCLNLNGGWIPRTWNFDDARDTAAQEVGGTPVPGIDVNTLYRPIFGAPEPPPTKKKGGDMDLVVVKGDGFWVRNNQFWRVGPGVDAQRVDVDEHGAPVPFADIVANWGWLPYGAQPASIVDGYVTASIKQAVLNQNLDTFLKNPPTGGGGGGTSPVQVKQIVDDALNATSLHVGA